MPVDEQIHFALAVIYEAAKGKPYHIRLLMAGIMEQLLTVNRIMKEGLPHE